MCVPRGMRGGGGAAFGSRAKAKPKHTLRQPSDTFVSKRYSYSNSYRYRYRYNCELQLCRRHINSWQHVQRQTISGDVWQMFLDESSHLNRIEREREGERECSVCASETGISWVQVA